VPTVRRSACFHANQARRKIGKELKNLRSTNTPADHHHAIRIDAVNLKRRFRNIDPDRANLTQGRLPSMYSITTEIALQRVWVQCDKSRGIGV